MKSTTDLWLASFLMLKGYKVADFKQKERGRGSFEFDIEEEQWKELKMEFSHSDVTKIKYFHEQLKDMLY